MKTVDLFRERAVAHRIEVRGPIPRAELMDEVRTLIPADARKILALIEGFDSADHEVIGPSQNWINECATVDVAINEATMAIAETGSVVCFADATQPRAATVLPTHHICIVSEESILESVEDCFAEIASGQLSSSINIISGPSRTGDLEMETAYGVHGPLTLSYIVVKQ